MMCNTMSEMRQHYTTCMCPYCKSTFAVEVSLECIDVKTFTVDIPTEDKTEHIK